MLAEVFAGGWGWGLWEKRRRRCRSDLLGSPLCSLFELLSEAFFRMEFMHSKSNTYLGKAL